MRAFPARHQWPPTSPATPSPALWVKFFTSPIATLLCSTRLIRAFAKGCSECFSRAPVTCKRWIIFSCISADWAEKTESKLKGPFCKLSSVRFEVPPAIPKLPTVPELPVIPESLETPKPPATPDSPVIPEPPTIPNSVTCGAP